MAKTVFGKTEIDIWDKLLDERRPARIRDEAEFETLPQVEAFASSALNVGMAFRLAARDGSEYAFSINPVAARQLATAILLMGQAAGWLDEKGDIKCPPLPKLDA